MTSFNEWYANNAAMAEKAGFEVIPHPKLTHTFQLGTRHVWSTFDAWQTADLIDGRYCNHQKFNSLSDALNRGRTT